nr:MAG TPA: hypothetical protein [Caudoviricetes sp.]
MSMRNLLFFSFASNFEAHRAWGLPAPPPPGCWTAGAASGTTDSGASTGEAAGGAGGAETKEIYAKS